MKKTKIIATLGPSSDTPEIIEKLYQNWANIVRMNYSHTNLNILEKLLIQ